MIANGARRLSWISPSIALYFFAVSTVGFALDGGVYSVLLNLFLVRLDYGPEQIGLVNSVGTFTFALSSLPAGLLGERWGSRRALMLGLGLMSVCAGLLPLADSLALSWQLPWLMVNIGVLYLGLAIFFVNTAPYVIQSVGPERRNQVVALQTALLSLAAFLGSLLGGFLPPLIAGLIGDTLSQPAPYRYALMVAGLAMLPAIFAMRAANPAPQHAETVSMATAVAQKGLPAAAPILGLLALIALVRIFQVAGVASVNTFFNVYLDSALLVPTAQIGMIIAAARLLGVPAALTTSLLTKRFGNRGVVTGSLLASAICILPIALIPHVGAASFSLISIVSLSWIRYASSIVYFLELVPPDKRATVSGVTEMAAGVCFTMVTFGGGILIARYGYASLFLISAAVTFFGALLFWFSFRNRKAYG
jgi:MFS family permease